MEIMIRRNERKGWKTEKAFWRKRKKAFRTQAFVTLSAIAIFAVKRIISETLRRGEEEAEDLQSFEKE